MSRVGKAPIEVPAGVEISVVGATLKAKGKLGELSTTIPNEVKMNQEGSTITFAPTNNSKIAKALWGTTRANAANVIKGVTQGFEKKLSLKGVGYRANVAGTKLNLSLGFSHPVEMDIPQGLSAEVTKDGEIIIKGADKQAVGQFAAEVRAWRKVEPFKGKGIRYVGEHVVMKEGKKK